MMYLKCWKKVTYNLEHYSQEGAHLELKDSFPDKKKWMEFITTNPAL